MGTNCGDHPEPNTSNVCSNSIGDVHHLPNFCTLAGSHDGTRAEYCARMSNGEWVLHGSSGTCQYNDCDEVTDFGFGCCRGCCGILGLGADCRRVAFKGDPLLCCLKDQACNTAPDAARSACFDDNTQKQTCDPATRDLASAPCRTRIAQYCTGVKPDGTKEDAGVWQQRWLGRVTIRGPDGVDQSFDRPCYHALYRNLYDKRPRGCEGVPLPPSVEPSGAGYIYAQDLVSAMIQRYTEDGGRLDATESSQGNTLLNDTIRGICIHKPGLCTKALTQFCTNTTTETLTRSASILPWCGCNMPPEEYAKYTDQYQLGRECTPMCNRKDVIPLPSDDGTGTKVCQQSSCIIDDVSIGIARSVVGTNGGGISFSQLCSSCQAAVEGGGIGVCTCLISNATYDIIDSKIGNISISQQCGASGICYKDTKQPDGSTRSVRVPCTSPSDYNPYAELEKQEAANLAQARTLQTWKIILIILGVIIIIIFLWIILYPYIRRGTVSYTPVVATAPPISAPIQPAIIAAKTGGPTLSTENFAPSVATQLSFAPAA